eukprot:5434127-Pleurochrysis_carterae.AAC.1
MLGNVTLVAPVGARARTRAAHGAARETPLFPTLPHEAPTPAWACASDFTPHLPPVLHWPTYPSPLPKQQRPVAALLDSPPSFAASHAT